MRYREELPPTHVLCLVISTCQAPSVIGLVPPLVSKKAEKKYGALWRLLTGQITVCVHVCFDGIVHFVVNTGLPA